MVGVAEFFGRPFLETNLANLITSSHKLCEASYLPALPFSPWAEKVKTASRLAVNLKLIDKTFEINKLK